MISFNGTNITSLTFNGTTIEKATFNGTQVFPQECSYVCFNETPYICWYFACSYSSTYNAVCKACVFLPKTTYCQFDGADTCTQVVILYGGSACYCSAKDASYESFDPGKYVVCSVQLQPGVNNDLVIEIPKWASYKDIPTSDTYCGLRNAIPSLGAYIVRSDGKMGTVVDSWNSSSICANFSFGQSLINACCGDNFIKNAVSFPVGTYMEFYGITGNPSCCTSMDGYVLHQNHYRYNSCVTLC